MPVEKAFPLRRVLATGIIVAALAIGVSACGSSSSGSSSTSGSAGSGGTSTTSSTARYQARLNLAKCFRAHGINVPDPNPSGGAGGGGGGGGGGIFRQLQQYPQSQIQSAEQACSQYVKQAFAFANASPAQIAQFRQQFVKYAECMRSHGVNIPDPTTNSGGGFGLRGVLGSVNRNSPAFQSANTACQSLRPRFGRGGGGAAGGAPGA